MFDITNANDISLDKNQVCVKLNKAKTQILQVNCLYEIYEEIFINSPLSQFILRLAIHRAYSCIFHSCIFSRPILEPVRCVTYLLVGLLVF